MNITEGFEHKGKTLIPSKKKAISVIKSAQYGSIGALVAGLSNNSNWKGVVDVKPILDELIDSGSASTIVSNITFGGVSDESVTDKILLVQFINPRIKPFDAYSEIPESKGFWAPYSNSWYWRESDTVTLKFDTGEPPPFWVRFIESIYEIARVISMATIQTTYKIINKTVNFLPNMASSAGSTVNTPQNEKSKIMSPIKNFFKELWSIIKYIFKTIYGWFKWYFLKFINTIRDIPGFLTYIFTGIIKFIRTVVTKTFNLLHTIFEAIKTVFKAIIQIPLMIFDILEKLISMILNLITMLIKLPITILNMTIGIQNIILDIMNKNPKIPFIDMFFG